jgi:hypothetical protein
MPEEVKKKSKVILSTVVFVLIMVIVMVLVSLL